jgi:hypothetical protein
MVLAYRNSVTNFVARQMLRHPNRDDVGVCPLAGEQWRFVELSVFCPFSRRGIQQQNVPPRSSMGRSPLLRL